MISLGSFFAYKRPSQSRENARGGSELRKVFVIESRRGSLLESMALLHHNVSYNLLTWVFADDVCWQIIQSALF